MKAVTFLLSVAACASLACAGFGPCRYDTKCSCKMGEESQGICWDKVLGSPNTCKARPCNAGWTCSCGGRTHVCNVGQIQAYQNTEDPVTIGQVVNAVASSNSDVTTFSNIRQAKSITAVRQAVDGLTRQCSQKAVTVVSSRDIKLGTVSFKFSSTGLGKQNGCGQVISWHNGNIIDKHENNGEALTGVQHAETLDKIQEHSLLELRSGDVVSFRFRGGSYYCYKHLTSFTIDGVPVESTALGFETRFAREYTEGWYNKDFDISSHIAEVERPDNLPDFIPLRKRMLPVNDDATEGPEIIPGVDLWKARTAENANDPNHKISNWYFRITIPATIQS